jgi:hypothetical protein
VHLIFYIKYLFFSIKLCLQLFWHCGGDSDPSGQAFLPTQMAKAFVGFAAQGCGFQGDAKQMGD